MELTFEEKTKLKDSITFSPQVNGWVADWTYFETIIENRVKAIEDRASVEAINNVIHDNLEATCDDCETSDVHINMGVVSDIATAIHKLITGGR